MVTMRSMPSTMAIRGTAFAAGIMLAGAAILLVAAVIELATGQPGMNLEDAYWVGRLPWTPIGVGMVLFGATATVVVGSIASWLAAGWLRRVVSVGALLSTAVWWAISPIIPFSGGCCGPRPAYDPITIAYSDPKSALVLVVVPALIVAAVVLLPTRSRPAEAKAAIKSA
jgi:hypothetical protein